jgi:hypothetical protein
MSACLLFLQVLCEATWDGPLVDAKAARDTLSMLMHGAVA